MTRPQLMVSLLATFEGINPAKWYPCESYAKHMIPEEEHGLRYTDREIYESDWCEGMWHDAGFRIAPEDEEERIKAEEEQGDNWEQWDELREIQVQGVVTFEQAVEYLEHIGAIFEDCETMGTFGGPLGLVIVQDIPFRVESQLVVSSIRITPFWVDGNGEWSALTEASWERLRGLFREHDLWSIRRMVRNRVEVS